MRTFFKKGLSMVVAASLVLAAPIVVGAADGADDSEVLTSAEWWTTDWGKDYEFNGDGTMELDIEAQALVNGGGAFSVEVYSDTYFFTTGSDKNAWTAESATGTVGGAVFTGSELKEGTTYKITVDRKGTDITVTYVDTTDNSEYCKLTLVDSNMPENLKVHVKAQVGTFKVTTVSNSTVTPPATTEPSVKPSTKPSATPAAKSTITVKNGKKKVSSVKVKKGKKVTLTVSVTPKTAKVSLKALSKKDKKICKATLKKGKLTIKGVKKGSVTLKLTVKKTAKIKASTKNIKVKVTK